MPAAGYNNLHEHPCSLCYCYVFSIYIQSLSQELSSESGKLVAKRCDVRQEQEVKEVFQFARTQFGGVDVCINNAGLAHNAPMLSGKTEDWREILEVIFDLYVPTLLHDLTRPAIND